MKILYINTYFYGGGAEKVARQLYFGMKQRGIETFFLAGRWQKNIPEDIDVIYSDFVGRCMTTVTGSLISNTLLRTVRAKNAVIKMIKEKKIDIVHFHNLHSNYIGIADLVEIKKYCSNIVITLHDMWMLTGGCAYAFECIKWKNGNSCTGCSGNECMKSGTGFSQALLKYKIQYFQNKGIYFVLPSEWLYDCCKESYLKEENLRVIRNGISVNTFKLLNKSALRKKHKLPEDKRILLFVSNGINNVYKGFPYLSQALQKLSAKEKYALLIVGNKEKFEISESYEIYEAGYIRDEFMLNEFYAAADLFILPSIADTLPFTAMESMASGTPVLAFETGGIPEIISENGGWLVERGNSGALAKKISEIFDGKSEIESKAKKCRQHIEKEYTEDIMLGNYEMLYKQLMGRI